MSERREGKHSWPAVILELEYWKPDDDQIYVVLHSDCILFGESIESHFFHSL